MIQERLSDLGLLSIERESVSKTLTEMPLVVNELMLKQERVYFSLVDIMTATMLAKVSYVL